MPLYELKFADPNKATIYHFARDDEEADRFVREVILAGQHVTREPVPTVDSNGEETRPL